MSPHHSTYQQQQLCNTYTKVSRENYYLKYFSCLFFLFDDRHSAIRQVWSCDMRVHLHTTALKHMQP
jgi:hypothetical protein